MWEVRGGLGDGVGGVLHGVAGSANGVGDGVGGELREVTKCVENTLQ